MFYYYGGKRRLARFYPAPEYSTIIEPFAGSAAYSVTHLIPPKGATASPVERVILVEKDPRVCETWDRLLKMDTEEVRALSIPRVGARIDDFLLMTSACSNRIARQKEMVVTARMPVVLKRMFKQIAAALPHVKGRVEIIEGDYTAAPDVEATWFIDPPYHVGSRAQQRGMGYAEECNSAALDYSALAKWCKERRGQKIVCEQDGADWLHFEHLGVAARNSIGLSTTEVVWADPPPPVTQLNLSPTLAHAPLPAIA